MCLFLLRPPALQKRAMISAPCLGDPRKRGHHATVGTDHRPFSRFSVVVSRTLSKRRRKPECSDVLYEKRAREAKIHLAQRDKIALAAVWTEAIYA